MTTFSATFSDLVHSYGVAPRFTITKNSKRTFSHAYAVFFTDEKGEANSVAGWAGSHELAMKAVRGWLARAAHTTATAVRYEIVPATAI